MNKITDKNENTKKESEDDSQKHPRRASKNQSAKSVDVKEKIISDLKVKLKEAEDKLLRELAENENLRKRHEKESQENFKYAIKNFSYDLLNVTDNFERALSSIPKENQEDANLKNLVIGLQAVEKEIYEIFEKNGVKRFNSYKEKFNPDIHQAVSKKESEFPEGIVVEELQKGFMIADRLLRPAMVIVSSGKINNKKD